MHRLAEHTTTTAAEALADAEVALLPTGSTEQHGPALPPGTDHLAAEAVARTTERDDAVETSVMLALRDDPVREDALADAEAGEALLERAAADLYALVDWLAARSFEDLLPEAHL